MIDKIKKKYTILFLFFVLVLITPFTYSRYISKFTKHIIISAVNSGYVVKFDPNGGTGTVKTQNFESGVSEKLQKSDFTKTDYVFWKWNTSPDGTGTSYDDEQLVIDLPVGDDNTITLYAIYSREYYSNNGDVVFDGSSNSYINTNIYLFNEKNIKKDFEVSFEITNLDTNIAYSTLMSAMDESGDPWPGMVFRFINEWQYQVVINASASEKINKNYDYGNIKKITFKRVYGAIYLKINDGDDVELLDVSSMENTFDYPLVFGASLDGSKNPQRYFQGTLSNLKVVVTDPNNELGLIKYHSNNEIGSNIAQHVKADTTYNVLENPYTRPGYIFTGWNTKPDGTGTSYAEGQEIINIVSPGNKYDLYAQWKTYNYTVTFDANGGDGNMDSLEFVSAEPKNLPQSSFTKTGYSFAFWNTKADGSGVSYEDQESVVNISTQGEPITLYAMYEQFSYQLDEKIFNGTTDYINTNIYLFSRKNVNKNFEISFEIKSIDSTEDFDTIVSSLDESGDPYAGFVFRINQKESGFVYELEANSSKSKEVVKNPDLVTPLKVVIRRDNGVLKMQLGTEAEEVIIDYNTLTKHFYYPLTVGASLTNKATDGSMMNFDVWRYFHGTISNLSITLDNTEPTESTEPTQSTETTDSTQPNGE